MATVKARPLVSAKGVATVPSLSRPRTLDLMVDRSRQLLERDNEVQKASPLLDGRFVSGKTSDVGIELKLIHRLGREPQGWIVVDQQDVPFFMVRLAWDKDTITLYPVTGASVDSPFKLYIF